MAKFDFEIPEQKKKLALDLKESDLTILNNFCEYLSQKNSTTKRALEVKADVVISGLIKTLLKDKEFKKFSDSKKNSLNSGAKKPGADSAHAT